MKQPIVLVLVLFLMHQGYSGNHYTYPLVSGNPVITASSVKPGLQHGDTLDIPANAVYSSFTVSNVNGIAGDSIVIRWLPGAHISTTVAYAIGEWTNVSFVKVIGLTSWNNKSTPIALRAGCHSDRFTQCGFTNDPGLYSTQAAVVIDDQYGKSMYFTGAKSQAFYDIRVDQSVFSGFIDVQAISAGTDNTRSVCLDVELDHNTFKNITQDGAVVPFAMTISGYNFKIHDNVFDSLAYNKGACQCSHNSWITIYGNGTIYNNKFFHTYGNDIRIVPLKFSGLAGYNGPISVYNNISAWHASYGMVETSPNNGYGRAAGNSGYVSFTDTRIYFNTVYRTNRASYNGDYAGMVADVYAQNGSSTPVYNATVFVHNNVIIAPEQDRPFNKAARGYVMYFWSGALAIDSGGNKVYQTLAQAGITDTIKWMPGAASPLPKAADVSNPSVVSDIYGNLRPQSSSKSVGAVEAQAVTAPVTVNQPPVANAGADTSITLPVNTAALNGSKSTDADGTIAGYSWTMISGPATCKMTNASAAGTAVSNLAQGAYRFRLQVTDNAGAVSADTVVITVNAAPVSVVAPVAGTGSGLKADYYNTNDLSGAVVLTRTDATINFDWQGGSPATAIHADNFSARWTGQVQPAYSETYTFYTLSDDGIRLWVNGQPIISDWSVHGATEDKGTITLAAGQKYSIVLEYYENAGGATATLSWSSASTAKAIIPQNRLFPPLTSGGTGTGTGLQGNYYNTTDLSGAVVLSRTDATVNFDWQSGSPAATVHADNFSARWTGQVEAAYSETYTFYTLGDDGVRLWVNGQPIISDWSVHGATEDKGTITLAGGQKYSIVMEYYENAGSATAALSWSSPSTIKAIIPQSRLYGPAPIVTGQAQEGKVSSLISQEPLFTAKTGLAPNPVAAGQSVRLSFNSMNGGTVAVQVIDIGGRMAQALQVNAVAGINTTMITTSGLTRGMYVVRVVEAGKATSFKLLVQ